MPEINPHVYREMLLSKEIKNTQQKGQRVSSTTGVGKTGFQTQNIET